MKEKGQMLKLYKNLFSINIKKSLQDLQMKLNKINKWRNFVNSQLCKIMNGLDKTGEKLGLDIVH